MVLPKGNIKFSFEIKQKDELKRAFDLLDENGFGTIDCQDIVIAVRALGLCIDPNELSKLIRRFDSQKTGTVDFRAFLCIIENLVFKEYSDDELSKSFRIFCPKDSSFIEFRDLQGVIQQLNEDISEEELQALFRGADLNSDGIVDFNEFSIVLKTNPFSRSFQTIM